MQSFEQYLHYRQLSPKSIETYNRYKNIFFNYLESEGLQATELTYTDLLDFVGYCKQRGLKESYIMMVLGVVRHYYNYLKYTHQTKSNPASGLYLRGKQKTLPHDLLTHDQLEQIYSEFKQTGLVGKRNRVMLGLMIYQGLTSRELYLLEPANINLQEAKILIPGTRRSKRRTLSLEAHQVIDMQQYIEKTRGLIIEIAGKQTAKLFTSLGESDNLRNTIDKLMRALRKQFDFVVNAKQLRQSRLGIWIKQYDIRKVQYLAGHKYVSSTERYQSTNLGDLQKELQKHHPSAE